MTRLVVAVHDGAALTYDTDDVEWLEFSTPNDVHELPSQPGDKGMRRELGQAHLHLTVHFKPGKRALWVKEVEVGDH